jgi:hypothetical protein
MSFWNPYELSSDAPWNLKRVLHLHRPWYSGRPGMRFSETCRPPSIAC